MRINSSNSKNTNHTEYNHEDSIISRSIDINSNPSIATTTIKSAKSHDSDFDVISLVEATNNAENETMNIIETQEAKQVDSDKINEKNNNLPSKNEKNNNSPTTIIIKHESTNNYNNNNNRSDRNNSKVRKSPSTIVIAHNKNNKELLQVGNKKNIFDSPPSSLLMDTPQHFASTPPKDVDVMDVELASYDSRGYGNSYASEGQEHILKTQNSDSFNYNGPFKLASDNKNFGSHKKKTKGHSIMDQIQEVLSYEMPEMDEDEFEVQGSPSYDPEYVGSTKL